MKTRDQIIAKAGRLCREISQTFQDVQHWNNIHPDEEPINPDPDGFLAHMLEILDGVLAREKKNITDIGIPITEEKQGK